MDKKGYILTIDAGTGSGRALLFDLTGRQVAVVQKEWLPKTLPQYPGSQEFDTTANWEILKNCIRRVIEKAKIQSHEILGISATSMREGFILYDNKGHEIWGITNVDVRSHEEVHELSKMGLGKKIYSVGGDWLSIIAPPRLLWLKRHEPQIYEKIDGITMLSDWVLYRLTGNFVTDPSVGASSGMFNLSNRTWSEEIISWCDLPKDIYPPVYEAGTVVGEVKPSAAFETGLKEGTPVVITGADTQLALVGVGAVKPNQYVIVGGTQWQTTVIADKPLIHPGYKPRTLCHSVPGQWMVEGIGFFHGFAMRWFRDAFCQEEKKKAIREGIDPYSIMEEMAQEVPPGSHGLLAIFSNLMDARCWKHATPSFVQFDIFSPEASGKKECIRCLEENAAYVAKGHLKELVNLTGEEPKEITFCGGSSKGFLWPQILSDVLGITVKIPVIKEATCLGSAMFVGVGLGFYSNIEEAKDSVVSWERTYVPNREYNKIYRDYYEKWLSIYPRFLQITEEESLKHMWKAPGI